LKHNKRKLEISMMPIYENHHNTLCSMGFKDKKNFADSYIEVDTAVFASEQDVVDVTYKEMILSFA
jgi:hypothetical protein